MPEAEPRLSKELLRRVGMAVAAAVGGEGKWPGFGDESLLVLGVVVLLLLA